MQFKVLNQYFLKFIVSKQTANRVSRTFQHANVTLFDLSEQMPML